ncbi:hypothetical protein AYO44_06060 [Planctomycetaceae bacterium SCGC AG-212-F19]|nr:hypothetical protein AYO44_06060 [Planctomycetaceae bacterium SCGC AG-212-F19]
MSRFFFRQTVLGVLAMLGLVVVVLAVVVEHRFWWLTLTGRRTTAKISAREVNVVGYIVRRGMREALYETEFQYTFADDGGKAQQGAFTLIGSSDDFRIGQEIAIMMPRFGSGPSVPASWSFYLEHDVQWLSFTVAGLVCLVGAVVCLIWRARTPAA